MKSPSSVRRRTCLTDCRVVAIVVIVAGAALAGCSKAQAKVAPDQPPLDVPAPPPRYVEAAEPEPPPPAPPVAEVPVASPAAPVRRAAPPASPRAEPTRPEPARADVLPPSEAPKPADEAKGPPPGPLQTTPATKEAQVERGIQELLARASANLSRVNYRGLNVAARAQYDQARRFISQAQDAVREKNLVYAMNLADKANTLAAQLAGR